MRLRGENNGDYIGKSTSKQMFYFLPNNAVGSVSPPCRKLARRFRFPPSDVVGSAAAALSEPRAHRWTLSVAALLSERPPQQLSVRRSCTSASCCSRRPREPAAPSGSVVCGEPHREAGRGESRRVRGAPRPGYAQVGGGVGRGREEGRRARRASRARRWTSLTRAELVVSAVKYLLRCVLVLTYLLTPTAEGARPRVGTKVQVPPRQTPLGTPMVLRAHVALLASLLCLCAALEVSRPCGRRSVRPARLRAGRSSRPVAAVGDKVRLTVDLGKDGEPKGETSVVFTPLLSRSVFVQVKG